MRKGTRDTMRGDVRDTRTEGIRDARKGESSEATNRRRWSYNR